MKFTQTKIPGVVIIEIETKIDERGFFTYTYDAEAFEKHCVPLQVVECNLSYNAQKGTLRGMHYQADPHGQIKLVSCTRGTIYDVILDLRNDSPTCKQWVAVELDASKHNALYVPTGCAHGYQTLTDDAEVAYMMGSRFVPEAGRGVRYDDPAFAITWPAAEQRIMSEKDRSYPDWEI